MTDRKENQTGSPASRYQKGRYCLDRGRLGEAERLFREGAALGEVKCLYGIAASLLAADRDAEEAVAVLREAIPKIERLAEEGDGEACFLLGRCRETGCGLPPDRGEAIAWYRRAADLGSGDALFNLGCLMAEDPAFLDKAVQTFFLPAAEAGSYSAQMAVGYYYEQRHDEARARKWYEAAAAD